MLEAGDILIRRGLIDQQQLDQLRQGGSSASSLVDAAIQQGMVGEESALRALGEELGMDFVDLRNAEVDLELVKSFPQKLIYRHSLFPLSRHNGSLTLATSDPLDVYALDEAGSATGLTIIPVVAERSEIARLMKKHLGVGSETVEGLLAARAEDDDVQLLEEIEVDGSELGEMAQEASVVRLVNEILVEAVDSRASDVHIESQTSGFVIRYRIDGILHVQPAPPEINRFQAAIISRLKIMARLNIAEKRLPQDGRIKLKVHGREIDVRLSVIPMIHAESMVMRILDKGAMKFDLLGLG
ncbi:MAG: general secretion pathway protein GspE, partial [Planctomycetales bacterium 12-60-4]